jgi:tRNA pseudouridine65 synthase
MTPLPPGGPPPPLAILARGPRWVAINKPPGRLVHNSAWAGPREHSVTEQLEAELGHPVHPVHRLDRGTSGVLLFAFDAEAVAQWQAALTSAAADKRYLAVVRGRNLVPQRIEHPVRRDKGRKERVEATSELISAVPSSVDRCSLAELRVLTGRWHQARQHLAHLRHPVLGDADHGDNKENRRYRDEHGLVGLALHAVSLAVTGPDGAPLTLVAPPPPALLALTDRLGLSGAATRSLSHERG